MRAVFLWPLIVLVSLFGAGNAKASADLVPQQKADNFVLLDETGEAHELFYHRNAKAIVLISHGNGCQILRSNNTDYQQLKSSFADKDVVFFMLNANLQDSRNSLQKEKAEWNLPFPILNDESQLITRSLNINRTGEVLVIDPRSWKVVYRGPVSDRVTFERQKERAENNYVASVLRKMIAGESPDYLALGSPGCLINIDKQPEQEISYAKDVVPILQKNCMACHVEGGIAPWAMSEFAMIKGFAPMIREVIRTKRMPPWHADPEIGHWSNDVGLSVEDTLTLVNWIESGAPRGDGDDPLKQENKQALTWPLGEPDLVIDIPAFDVPATGTVDYQFPVVENPLDEGVWIEAAAVIPGDPKVVHHILAGSSAEAPKNNSLSEVFENIFLTYAPGNEAARMPDSTGVYVPPGGVYQFQMHYTPYGKATTDRSRLGLYFAKEQPKYFHREHILVNPRIQIPANAAAHEQKAYLVFPKAAELYSFFPHAHYRGKSSRFDLVYPDGTREPLLSVPNYDFNWQRTYRLEEPKQVPAGTMILHRTVYDNSANNLGNPDPNEDVYWGLQSEQEMLYGSFGFRWLDETSNKPIHDRDQLEFLQMVGFMDEDLDGELNPDELPRELKAKLADNFSAFDRDNSGALNLQELGEAFKHAKAESAGD